MTDSFSEIVLSPQSEVARVRGWLKESGFRLIDEAFIEDAGHGYPVIKTCRGTETAYSGDELSVRAQMTYGPILLAGRDQTLKKYVEKEIKRLDLAISQVRSAGAEGRLGQLSLEREAACRALTLLTI